MKVDKARFQALVEARIAAPVAGTGPADEAERAACMLGDLVRRTGLMIEVLADDVRAWLADWTGTAMDVRIFEATEARSVGIGATFDEWLRHAEAVVIEVAGGPDLTLHEVSDTAERLYGWLPPNVDVVFGASIAEDLRGFVGIRLVALRAPS